MTDGPRSTVRLTLEFEPPVSPADIERECRALADAMADGEAGRDD
ncbi:hypothetical protein GCM10009646_79090 [Streptomyces aureus]